MPDWSWCVPASEPLNRAHRISTYGRTLTADVLTAGEGGEAVTKARKLATTYPIEFWQRACLLGRWDPDTILIQSAA